MDFLKAIVFYVIAVFIYENIGLILPFDNRIPRNPFGSADFRASHAQNRFICRRSSILLAVTGPFCLRRMNDAHRNFLCI